MTSLESELRPDELKALKACIQSLEECHHIAEIGTAAGGTLVELLKSLKARPGPMNASVSVVDTFGYFQDQYQIWCRNLGQNGFSPGNIRIYQCDSQRAFEQAVGKKVSFSLVLVDAGHKLKDVIRDVRWLSLLEVNGVGAFHDYSGRFPGVKIAVDTYLKRNPEFERLGLTGSLLLVRKKSVTNGYGMPNWLIAWMTFRSLLMQWGSSLRKRIPCR